MDQREELAIKQLLAWYKTVAVNTGSVTVGKDDLFAIIDLIEHKEKEILHLKTDGYKLFMDLKEKVTELLARTEPITLTVPEPSLLNNLDLKGAKI